MASAALCNGTVEHPPTQAAVIGGIGGGGAGDIHEVVDARQAWGIEIGVSDDLPGVLTSQANLSHNVSS
jgi:hypothetical protein